MKNINKIIRMASVVAALAVVFALASNAPFAKADECRGSCDTRYTSSYQGYSGYDRGSGYSYTRPSYPTYNRPSYPTYTQPAPVVITEPQIVYQQPTVVYQEPQVVYEQPSVVYQEPAPVYEAPISYEAPVSYEPTYYSSYSPLSVSCYANPSSVAVGQSVTWQAYASGGSGIYDYTWSGTDGSSYSSSPSAYSVYYSPGSYTASVTVYSNGQSITQSCGYASVVGTYSYNYAPTTYTANYPSTIVTNQNNNSGNLVAACFANRTAASIGTSVTWAVEVTGGTGQYSYSWSGSDGLASTGSSATQSYDTTGLKDATVLISSGGQTITQACGDSVSVRRYVSPATTNYQGPATNNSSNQNGTSSQNSLSAAVLLGLGNIPWGWIAILIIIIFGVTIAYLLFNRHKV